MSEDELDVLIKSLKAGDNAFDPGASEALRDIQRHVDLCDQCHRKVDMFRKLQDEFQALRFPKGALNRSICRSGVDWQGVVGGLLPTPETRELISHAARCDSCGELLRQATGILSEIVSPDEEHMLEHLDSSLPAWQQKLATKLASSSAVPRNEATLRSRFASWLWPSVAFGALALIVVLAIASRYWASSHESLSEIQHLIVQAYGEQRTMILRIQGAPYAQPRITRDGSIPPPSHSLREADGELARLSGKSGDPEWHILQSEVYLLEWRYESATQELHESQAISRSGSQKTRITIDLATALFESAKKTGNLSDYGTAAELLSGVLATDSENQVALFNRALVYNELKFYSQSAADWQHYLKVDPHGEWSKEAQHNLDEMLERLDSKRKHPPTSELVRPPDIFAALAPGISDDYLNSHIEEYQLELLTSWLPTYLTRASQGKSDRSNLAALARIAQTSRRLHGDIFLNDLLDSVFHQPLATSAMVNLSNAITANQRGDEKSALDRSRLAEKQFMAIGSQAGVLRAKFEEAYAWQFSFRARRCMVTGRDVALRSHRAGYRWLEAQALVEVAFCANMAGSLNEARTELQSAAGIAKAANYEESLERTMVGEAAIHWQIGSSHLAWTQVIEGLDRYWSHPVSDIRGISFYDLLDLVSEETGQWRLQQAVLQETIPLVDRQKDPLISAQTRYRLACSKLMSNDSGEAGRLLGQAVRLFSASPQTQSTIAQETVVQISLAKTEMLQGQMAPSLRRLEAIQPRIKSVEDRLSSLDFYSTLGEVYRRSGRLSDAEPMCINAIGMFRQGLQSLADPRDRLAWYHEGSAAYRSLVQLKIDENDYRSALKVWESYRRTVSNDLKEHSQTDFTMENTPEGLTRTGRGHVIEVVYAQLPDGLFAWLLSDNQMVGARLHRESLDTFGTVFPNRCSDPTSDAETILDIGHRLYNDLLQPFAEWIASNDTIIIQPDDELAQIPFVALVDESGEYLGIQHSVIIAPFAAFQRAGNSHRFGPRDSALLLVAGDPAGNGADDPIAMQEANRIASLFRRPVIVNAHLSGTKAFKRLLRNADVFHYAGHSASNVNGSAVFINQSSEAGRTPMLLRAEDLDSRMLTRCKLVVLSACVTDRGEDGRWFNRDNLALTFLEKGVPEVIATSWEVDSEASGRLMQCFYSNLLEGTSVADAMRLARNELFKTPERAHPYFWAGFSVLEQSLPE